MAVPARTELLCAGHRLGDGHPPPVGHRRNHFTELAIELQTVADEIPDTLVIVEVIETRQKIAAPAGRNQTIDPTTRPLPVQVLTNGLAQPLPLVRAERVLGFRFPEFPQ